MINNDRQPEMAMAAKTRNILSLEPRQIASKFQHLNFIASLTYDYRKLLSHRKIIVRFSCNQAPVARDY